MTVEIDTKQIAEVQAAVQTIYGSVFPQGDAAFVPKAFGWADDCFTGKYRDYQAIDARYHDFQHTLQVTLCMARLMRGRHVAKALPVLTQKMFEVGLLAILLHDTGYLKTREDTEGTGAKYTLIHVDRSIEFAAGLLKEKGLPIEEIQAVQNMIRCTGVNVNLSAIPFQSEQERITGYALGTGDLLGQMAAPDYVEKLPILYSEFAEAFHHNAGEMGSEELFSSAEDLLQKTPLFWDQYVKKKIEVEFQGLYRFLNEPYPDGNNLYVERIEKNMSRLRRQLKQAA
ncbi:MAG: HD domain-containing protein [Verrucomicrobiota bacterium]